MSEDTVKQILADIDDYTNTAFAMIGLANLYRFDDEAKTFRANARFYQGRRFDTSPDNRRSPSNTVRPDLAIVVPGETAALVEVKMSLPKDRELWQRVSEQLEGYDDDLIGWPTSDGRVHSHDIALIVHQTRVAVVEMIEGMRATGQLQIERPVYALSFIRSDQREAFFLFRLESGEPSFRPVRRRLEEPVSVPAEVLAVHYTKFKLWDTRPPVPYLMDLIWREVVADRAAGHDRFPTLRRNSRLPIELNVAEVAEYLQSNFSFHQSLGEHPELTERERQPSIPRIEWVRQALDCFTETELWRWLGNGRDRCEIDYQKAKLDIEEFARRYLSTGSGSEEYGGQANLFGPTDAEGISPSA